MSKLCHEESSDLSNSPPKPLYEPLNYEQNEIRLLRLPKQVNFKSETGSLDFTLETCELTSLRRYVAISYVWGPPVPCHTIKVNGVALTVRQNLYDFLMEALQPLERKTYHQNSGWKDWTDVEYLWIDQICIDQNNLGERADQVGKMGHIYTNAFETVLWLGTDTQETWKSEFLQVAPLPWDDQREDWWTKLPLRERVKEWLTRMFHNEYWSRSWIIQEILLSQSKMLWYGGLSITWGQFRLLNKKFRSNDTTFKDSTRGKLFEYLTSSTLRNEVGGMDMKNGTLKRGLGLADAIVRFKHLESEDPLDAVYALLSLVPQCYRSMIKIDYSIEPIALFVAVAAAIARCPWASVDADSYITACRALRDRLGLSGSEQEIHMILPTKPRAFEVLMIKPMELDEFHEWYLKAIQPRDTEPHNEDNPKSNSDWLPSLKTQSCFLLRQQNSQGQLSSEYRAAKIIERRQRLWIYHKSVTSTGSSIGQASRDIGDEWAAFVEFYGPDLIAAARLANE